MECSGGLNSFIEFHINTKSNCKKVPDCLTKIDRNAFVCKKCAVLICRTLCVRIQASFISNSAYHLPYTLIPCSIYPSYANVPLFTLSNTKHCIFIFALISLIRPLVIRTCSSSFTSTCSISLYNPSILDRILESIRCVGPNPSQFS